MSSVHSISPLCLVILGPMQIYQSFLKAVGLRNGIEAPDHQSILRAYWLFCIDSLMPSQGSGQPYFGHADVKYLFASFPSVDERRFNRASKQVKLDDVGFQHYGLVSSDAELNGKVA